MFPGTVLAVDYREFSQACPPKLLGVISAPITPNYAPQQIRPWRQSALLPGDPRVAPHPQRACLVIRNLAAELSSNTKATRQSWQLGLLPNHTEEETEAQRGESTCLASGRKRGL